MTTLKTILITGATSGIGATTARMLVEAGHNVAVTGRSADKLESFLQQLGRPDHTLGIRADAADWDATRQSVTDTIARFGRLDAAIANAGFASADYHDTRTNVFDDGDPTLWPPMVLTNVLGPALLAKASLPHLQATQGRLVLIGSVAGIKNAPGNLYSATKWAVTGLAENLRMYATTIGVGVTLISPGMTQTDFYPDGATPTYALPSQAVANAIIYAIEQPASVDVNTITVRPIGQPA